MASSLMLSSSPGNKALHILYSVGKVLVLWILKENDNDLWTICKTVL